MYRQGNLLLVFHLFNLFKLHGPMGHSGEEYKNPRSVQTPGISRDFMNLFLLLPSSFVVGLCKHA